MSRVARLVSRFSGVSLALGAMMVGAAQAQTAPQLLPYTVTVAAGGSATATPGANAACPVSGYTSTDAYGDGCLATEIQLTAPRYAIADKNSNIFFSDWTNGLVRRIDASTGIVTIIAGGAASNPGTGTVCGTGVSTDADGDGCLSTLVKLNHPVGLAFAANGDLYFADNGYDNVRKVASSNGLVTTGGVISLVAGSTSTYGYAANQGAATGVVVANTQGYLNFPYGIAFDTKGNLLIADEGNNAIVVVNLTGALETYQGLTIPPGTVAKIAGYGSLPGKTATGECPNFSSTTSRGGCYYATTSQLMEGAPGVTSNFRAPYGVTADPSGNVFFTNEYFDNVVRLTPGNALNLYAGTQNTAAKPPTTKRGVAGTFATGSPFDIAADALGNVYFTDASNGLVWRVDAVTKASYIVAGGAATVCSGSTDTYGDGCPATQATFGSSGTLFASSSSPGLFGITVDQYSNLYVGDTITNLVRKVSSGTQFGNVGLNGATQTLLIHFAPGDSPAANAYTITSGGAVFTLGSATCTSNSDTTVDCTLPVTAAPTTLGPFSGTLQVKSTAGGTGTFPLGGIFMNSPQTRTTLTVSNPGSTCATTTGTPTYATTAQLTLTAAVVSTGAPTGTVTFYDGGTQIGTPQAVTAGKATLSYTFSSAGTHNLTATYSGDSYFKTSSSAPVSIITSQPNFSVAAVTDSSVAQPGCPAGMVGRCTVPQGGTALYSFKITQSVYTGAITFACSGLPAYSSCQFSPSTISATACDTSNVVAVSILTQAPTVPAKAGFDGGRWPLLTMLSGVVLACSIGFRRRRLATRFGQLGMMLALLLAVSGMVACGKGSQGISGTPTGTSTVTITATGSAGTVSSFTVPLTVQ